MKAITGEMVERNIKRKFLNLNNFVINNETLEIEEVAFVEEVKRNYPTIIIIVICYSKTLDVKYLLETSSVLSGLRFKRELRIQSRGKILTMTDVQKEFLQTMANDENIAKPNVHIEGLVGSGKTLLGLEVLKMKVAHYKRLYKDCLLEGKKIRTMIVFEYGESNLLKTQLENELTLTLGNECVIEIYDQSIGIGVLTHLFLGHRSYKDFIHTIIMMDECNFEFMSRYKISDAFSSLAIDYIHCCRYEDTGKLKIEHDVFTDKDMVFARLLQCQRSSCQIIRLGNLFDRHVVKNFSKPIVSENGCFCSTHPQWLEPGVGKFILGSFFERKGG